jgi:hypothetical protein
MADGWRTYLLNMSDDAGHVEKYTRPTNSFPK